MANGEARWAEALITLSRRLSSTEGSARETLRGRIWEVLSLALIRASRRYAATLGSVSEDDLLDLTSEKSLDLLHRIDRGSWEPSQAHPAAVSRYVTRAARNGLVDVLRKQGRTVREDDLEVDPREQPDPRHQAQTDAGIADEAFVSALVQCVSELKPRSRNAWFFRVFYDMSSAAIGKHPDVQAKASHVDVILQRARDQVSRCLQGKGFGPEDIGPGSFAAMWRRFRTVKPQAVEEDSP